MADDTGDDIHDEDLAEAESLGDRGVIEKRPPVHAADFEGREIAGVNTRFRGATQRITREVHLDERVFTIHESVGGEVSFRDTGDGRKRHQALDTEDVWELTETEAREIIARKRAEAIEAGTFEGQMTLDDAGEHLVTDESGVVMTPGERAALVGEPSPAKGGRGGLPPIDGYVAMSASETITAIAALDDLKTVEAVIAYEAATKGRTSVLAAAKARSDALWEAGGS